MASLSTSIEVETINNTYVEALVDIEYQIFDEDIEILDINITDEIILSKAAVDKLKSYEYFQNMTLSLEEEYGDSLYMKVDL